VIPRPDRAAARAAAALGSAAGDVTGYLSRAVGLLDTAEQLAARAAALLDRVEAVTTRTEKVVAEIEATSASAAGQVLAVGRIAATAEGLTARGDRLVGRAEHLVDLGEPVATAAVPLARRFLDELTEQEIHAIVTLVDRAPEVLEHVDETVVPTMQRMSEVGPDIKELLLAVSAMRELVESLPGMGRVRRRMAQKERELEGDA
jgi:hypothetical protein